MKILLITGRYLPIFNKNNEGAIEKLERIYLEYNESTQDKFVVYSPKIAKDDFDSKKLKNVEFRIIDQASIRYKIIKLFFAIKKRLNHSSNNENYIRAIAKDINNKDEQNAYDLIIFENGEQDIPIFKKLTKTKTKTVLHLHNDYINKDIKESAAIIDSCNEIWAVSNFISNRIAEVKATNVKTIPNTIDNRQAFTNTKNIEKLSRKYESDKNRIYIYVGRLLESKGILQLIDAFNSVNKEDTNAKLLIIGKTEAGISGYKLLAKLKRAEKQNTNINLVGYIRPGELIEYQEIADCQIIPSMCNEAFGLVILEAMRANLPVIASRIGGIPEIGKNAIQYVDPQNLTTGLIEKMKHIKKNQKIDYAHILKEYSTKKYVQRMHTAIHGEK